MADTVGMPDIAAAAAVTSPNDVDDASGGVNAFLVGTVAPIIGVFTSEFMSFGPLQAIIECRRTGSLGEVNPLPFPLLFGNGIGWLIYSAATQNVYVFAGNLGGLPLALFYLMTAHTLTSSSKTRLQMEIIAISLLVLWIFVGFIAAMLYDRQDAVSLIGVIGNVIVLALFASPLSTFAKVVREKNSSSINRPFAYCQVLNCIVWCSYGLAIKDYYVAAPNVIGLALGITQVALIYSYPASHIAHKSVTPDLGPYDEFDSSSRITA